MEELKVCSQKGETFHTRRKGPVWWLKMLQMSLYVILSLGSTTFPVSFAGGRRSRLRTSGSLLTSPSWVERNTTMIGDIRVNLLREVLFNFGT